MEEFLSRHADAVTGTLSGFDRLVFRGTLRMLAHRSGMMGYLWAMQVLLKDFASHAQALTRQLREASEELARRSVRPIRYLASSATSKEDIARQIARADGIERGLICILWGIHLTGVERRLGQWNVAMPAPTTLSLLGSFRLGSRLMQTAWTTWNGCDGLAASSARAAVVREDGGLGTAGSCVLDAVAAHQ